MTNLKDFNFFIPTRFEFGVGKFNSLGNETKKLGKRALLVSYKDPALKHYVQQAVELLYQEDIETILFEEVEANPDHKMINRGGMLARSQGSDVVIGLGGGSAMDTAKAIAVIAKENVDIWKIVEGQPITTERFPLILVPTTAGTGSEATQYAVISNRELHRKEGFAKKEFYSDISILDPILTVEMPPHITAETGMDALTHAIEAYTTKYANTITDILAEEAIKLIASNLRKAVFDGKDLNARTNMLLANTLAGMAITHADTSLCHVIGEAIGAVYNTAHGLSVSLTLPAVMEFNIGTNLEKFAKIAILMGETTKALSMRGVAEKAPGSVRQLIMDIGMPNGLAEIGVKENTEVLDLCTRPGWDAANRRPASREDFKQIIKGSLSRDMSYWKYCN
jgi:alcohol dehydrogenase class IV